MPDLTIFFPQKDHTHKYRTTNEISGLSFNSKTVKKDEIFIAVKGQITDGIAYAEEAVANGAAAVVCDKRSLIPEELSDFLEEKGVPLYKVKNPEIIAAKMAKTLYPGQPEFVFAITGTNGKTTITDFTEQLLNLLGYKETALLGTMGFQSRNNKFRKLKNEINDLIGVNPLTTQDTITLHRILDRAKVSGVKYLILEASSDGIMRRRIDEIDFVSCGLSNISEDHLITHGSMRNYINTKLSLFSRLSSGKTAVYNNDDEHAKKVSDYLNKKPPDKNLKIIRYGKNSFGNEIQIKNIYQNKSGYDLEIKIYDKNYKAKLSLTGEFQVYNAMHALGFVLSILPKNKIHLAVDMLAKLKTVNGRMELVNTTKKGARVYVDYAHNPSALEKALIELKKITSGRIISVTGISSGKSEARNETAKIAGKYADVVIFTYISPRFETADEIIAKQQKVFPGGLHGGKTRYAAIKKAIKIAQKGDSILINGQGHERFIVEWGKPTPFYDPDAVNDIISKF